MKAWIMIALLFLVTAGVRAEEEPKRERAGINSCLYNGQWYYQNFPCDFKPRYDKPAKKREENKQEAKEAEKK